MAFDTSRTRRVAAIRCMIGIVVELGGTIADGLSHLDPAEIDVLVEELRLRLVDCADRLDPPEPTPVRALRPLREEELPF